MRTRTTRPRSALRTIDDCNPQMVGLHETFLSMLGDVSPNMPGKTQVRLSARNTMSHLAVTLRANEWAGGSISACGVQPFCGTHSFQKDFSATHRAE